MGHDLLAFVFGDEGALGIGVGEGNNHQEGACASFSLEASQLSARPVHSVVVTSANVRAKHLLPDLLHSNEPRVYGDSAYASQKALVALKAPHANDFTNQCVGPCRARLRGGQAALGVH